MQQTVFPISRALFAAVASCAAISTGVAALDWPTAGGDVRRSNASAETLDWPLAEGWRHVSPYAPQPAWPESPAKQDVWRKVYGLSPTVTFDRAFQPVVAQGRLYYGSSADDAVHCLDAATGRALWSYVAEGPVRLSPTICAGKVYFGADDGCVYCLEAETGSLIWKLRPSESDRRLPGNGRMMSLWPIRSGVLVDGKVAYFTAGLFPSQGAWLCAVDAATGQTIWKQDVDISPQGYLLASSDRLFVPTGRAAPHIYLRDGGGQVAAFPGGGQQRSGFPEGGGSYALVVDDVLVHAGGEKGDLQFTATATRERIIASPGIRLVASGQDAYILSMDKLTAIHRARYLEMMQLQQKKDKTPQDSERLAALRGSQDPAILWDIPCTASCALIAAGRHVICGGDGMVVAYDGQTGKKMWEAAVDGKAYALAVADQRLYVGTDSGAIHCFEPRKPTTQTTPPLVADDPPATAAEPSPACAILEPLLERGAQGYCLVLPGSDNSLATQTAARTRLNLVCPILAVKENSPNGDRSSCAGSEQTGSEQTGSEQTGSEQTGSERADSERAGSYRNAPIASGTQPGLGDQAATVAATTGDIGAVRRHAGGHLGAMADRIAYHAVSPGRLPYQSRVFNAIIGNVRSADVCPVSANEAFRLLRPSGGVVALVAPNTPAFEQALRRWGEDDIPGWTVEKAGPDGQWLLGVGRRGPLAGAGEWTHFYGDPGNSACSGDTLDFGPVDIQWFGRPGPRRMVDRHEKTMAPLYKDGRMFVTGDNYIVGVDAYNGTVLWERDIHESIRLGAFKNSGSMAVGDTHLYVASADTCVALDVRTGETAATFTAPPTCDGQKGEWGYVATLGGLVLGSTTKPDANWRIQDIDTQTLIWRDKQPVVASDALFAVDPASGKNAWTYRPSEGVIVNPTLTAAADRVYFVESANHSTFDVANGRITLDLLFGKGADLVALELHTGKPVWRTRIDLSALENVVFMSHADDTLVITGSRNAVIEEGQKARVRYDLWAFDAPSGKLLWNTTQTPIPDHLLSGPHGEQVQHSAIVGGVIYNTGFACHLRTGQPFEGWKWQKGDKCGTVCASASCMFSRYVTPRMFSIENGQYLSLTSVTRPGCWINILPAGGLVLIPEASSGCTCYYPVQTSIALAPIGP